MNLGVVNTQLKVRKEVEFMPYTMTHLIITENLSKIFTNQIKDLPQFYLGNVAPDAVHNRADYISDYKKESHLCVGDEKWGMTTNIDEWKSNVIKFLNNHKNSENHDFIVGYCCHILSDIYNNMALWIPFKQRYADEAHEIEKGRVNLMQRETNMVDIELALTHEKKDIFWSNIQQSTGIDLAGIIYAAEIERHKDNILNIWYADKERKDLTSNEVVTVEIIMNLIKNAVDFIVLTLQEHLN